MGDKISNCTHTSDMDNEASENFEEEMDPIPTGINSRSFLLLTKVYLILFIEY